MTELLTLDMSEEEVVAVYARRLGISIEAEIARKREKMDEIRAKASPRAGFGAENAKNIGS